MNEKSLEPKDLKCVAKAVYRRRRKTHPPLHTSQQETHENLQKMNIETNKFENFLQVNDAENGIFMDGTLGVVPSFLNNIHGYKDGNYIPLVFILLPGKSEEIYHTCISALETNEKNLKMFTSLKRQL